MVVYCELKLRYSLFHCLAFAALKQNQKRIAVENIKWVVFLFIKINSVLDEYAHV